MDATFKSKRTEMQCLMAEWLGAGGAFPNLTDLKQDVGSPTFYYDTANKKCLESKRRYQGQDPQVPRYSLCPVPPLRLFG